MIKYRKYLLICLCIIGAFAADTNAQKLDGVYAGAQLYTSPFNGMQINYFSVYFRSDGTYTDKMNAKTWRTDVAGRYTVSNGAVHFIYDKDEKTYKLNSSGNLESTQGIRHTLYKLKSITALPASAYERKSAPGSGGIGTNTPYVGAFSSDFLYFDGKSNFSSDKSSVVGIGGETATGGTIAGKYNNNKSAAGTYKLSPGEITLSYNSGTVVKHSLFYSPPGQQDMLVMDGDFYFRQKKEKTTGGRPTITAPKQNTGSPETGELSAAQLLSKLRAAYGGESIDKINTVRETSTITGNLQATALTDIDANKFRLEVRQNGQLLLVKQLEGNESWQWLKGVKSPLPQNDKTDMALSLYQGIIGLHKNLNSYFSAGTVSKSGEDYMLTLFVNKSKVIYLIDGNYKIKANGYVVNGKPNYSVYRNFVTKAGITYPSVTESSDGKNKLIVTTTGIEFNPVFSADDWKTP